METKDKGLEKPQWFIDAINTSYEIDHVDVDGCKIEYYRWGDSSKPCLIFVHGSGGHANWWDFIAPSFTEHYCVLALHLSGMGNSEYRELYTFDVFAKDIISVANHAGFTSDITVVGHSLGGIVSLAASQIFSDQIKALVIIDSPVVQIHEGRGGKLKRSKNDDANPSKKHRGSSKNYYPDFDAALSRFRFIPDQACKNDFLVDHIARNSIREFEQGWSWKFDDAIVKRITAAGGPPDPLKVPNHFAYIYGESSLLVPKEDIPALYKMYDSSVPIIGITGGHHHLMLDEPLVLIKYLQEILNGWAVSS